MTDYSISNIYQGGYSSLKPQYGDIFTGYRINPGSMGITTDPRNANIVQEATTKLNMGVKQIELALVSPEVFDSIPRQQLKEINRLSKLTGIDVSVHGPVMGSSGMSQQGFSELNRVAEERRITDVLLRSTEVKPEGNVNVTFHSSESLPGSEWKTLGGQGKEREAKKIIAVDKESGKMIPLEEERKFYPSVHDKRGNIIGPMNEKGEVFSPERTLRMQNATVWDDKINQLFFNKERADEILSENAVQIQHVMDYINEAEKKKEKIALPPQLEQPYLKYKDAENYLSEINKTANGIFSKAYEYGNHDQKKALKQISEEYFEDVQVNGQDIVGQSRAMHKLLNKLQDPSLVPEMFVPIEKFAVEQSSKTFGNAAFNAYNAKGDKAPILTIENPPAGFALSTGEDLRNLIVESRKQFAKKAVEEKHISQREAEKLAEKFIGATWDVGHINMIRGKGEFGAKDVVSETEKIAPFVKHVHLSDNFGFEHTELPMGMGNVPTKEIFEKLGKEGFDAKKIIEAGQWWQHFKTPPLRETLEAFGSPIYGMQMAPYWNQSPGFQSDYFGGYGSMLPQINYETFGAGFSRLPSELGGSRQGADGSRMSGRSME
jgi:sugar phosphate isomerase/epimerase